MNIIDWFKNLIKSRTFNLIVQTALGLPRWSETNYNAFVKEGYQGNPYVFACIREIAMACSGIPWLVYKEKRGKYTQVERNDPLQKLLTRPNPWQGWGSFMETSVTYQYLHGNCYVEAVSANNRVPKELYSLRPDRIKIVPGDSVNPIKAYNYTIGGSEIPFTPEEILHIKFINPLDDWYGMPPLLAGAKSVDTDNQGRTWNMSLLSNSARPPGVLEIEENVRPENRTQLREEFEEQYAGAKRAGRPLLLEGGAKWKNTGLSPTDMDWVAGSAKTAREISTVLNVPPELIGDSANRTYSNYKEARLAFYTETVLPYMDFWKDELNNWLSPKFGKEYYVAYDKNNIEALHEERQVVWDRAYRGFTTGLLTQNEARQLVGHNSVRGGDTFFMPMNIIPSMAYEEKSFNINTENQKTNYWKYIDRSRQGWIKKIRELAGKLFIEEKENVLEHIQRGGKTPEDVIKKEDWLKFYETLYLTIGEEYAKRTLENFNQPKMLVKQAEEEWGSDYILRWLKHEAGKKIKHITETTLDSIREILTRGEKEGWGIAEYVKEIDNLYLENIIPHRSEVIARTEVISASNMGSYAGAHSLGYPMEKTWISTRDARTRDDHTEADGQTVDIDEPFEVGGEQLIFPGDTSLGASAENTIHCRCTLSYRLK